MKLILTSYALFRFIKDGLLSQVLESFLVVRSLVVQKTKLISDCGHLLKDLLDGLLEESFENKRHFIYACINGLQSHVKDKKDSTLMVSVASYYMHNLASCFVCSMSSWSFSINCLLP
jgi:hypothetical protein